MTAYDLPVDEPLRPDVASRAARSVVEKAALSASGALDKDGQMSHTEEFLAAVDPVISELKCSSV
jgi:hypothetical protein